jgi:hypothetical protein
MKKLFSTLLSGMLLMTATPMSATKLIGIKVIDKDYVMLHFRDGEVHYRDKGTGQSAYLGHSFAEGDDTLVVFGEKLKASSPEGRAVDYHIGRRQDIRQGSAPGRVAQV